jgi:predicted amidohydrolase
MRPGDARLDVFRKLSEEVTIILGAAEESEEFGVYNSAFVFDKGDVQVYRKVYPPDYGIFEERRYFLGGTSVAPVETRHGRIGVLVCEDLWHPALPLLMAYQGAKLLCVISASPARVPGKGGATNHELNSQHHTAYARLLSANLAFVNRTGYEDGVHFWGCSQFVNAHGNIVATADEFDEQLLVVECDDRDVRDARRNSRHFLDDDPVLLMRELERLFGA